MQLFSGQDKQILMTEKTYSDAVDFDVEDFLDDPEVANAMQDADDRFDLFAELKEARVAKKMTQQQVADAMKTTQSAVSDLENGHSDPQLSTVQRYARVVGSKFTFCLTKALEPDAREFVSYYDQTKNPNVNTFIVNTIIRFDSGFNGIYKKEKEPNVAA